MMVKAQKITAWQDIEGKLAFEKVAVVGLGYVGLPLCVALAKHFSSVVGFDISEARVRGLNIAHDATEEISSAELRRTTAMFSGNPDAIAEATFFIVTVPTPIDAEKRPDLTPLRSACEIIGKYLKKNDIVVFESTVYPGVTEEFCGPLLQQYSGLVAGVDFNLAYSPERINPGDKNNTVEKIKKIISADSAKALERVAAVYASTIVAGIHRAPSIKVAECAKVLENTQRDVNIALMNEMATICHRIGIRSADVIDAAASKWNFMPFRPGLVGGHCIGVDPYYLSALAERLNLHPELILAGRRVNNRMASVVAQQVLRQLTQRGGQVKGARVGLFGMTFKEDVPDARNSKSVDLYHELAAIGLDVMAHDAHASAAEMAALGVHLHDEAGLTDLDVMVVAVAHRDYLDDAEFAARLRPDGVFIDVKSAFRHRALSREATYWSL